MKSPESVNNFRPLLLALLALLLCELLLGFGVVKSISTPYIDPGDTTCPEYVSQIFQDNFRCWPLPHLNFVNDQALYPYGVNQCMQSWVLERDYFASFMRLCFGRFGWLQVYFLIGTLGGAIGVLHILRKEFGIPKALAVAVLSLFCNFYVINKYPHHHNLSTTHWVVLNVVMDYLLLHLAVYRKSISLPLVIGRCMVLLLMLGQDAAYLTTLTLSAFTVNQAVLWAVLLRQLWQNSVPVNEKRRWYLIKCCIHNLLVRWRDEWRSRRLACVAMLAISIIAAWFYIPVLGQIALTSKEQLHEAMQGPMAVNHDNSVISSNTPLRFLLPYFPGLNPSQTLGIVNDPVESLGAGSVGWTFLILAMLGCAMSWRRWPIWFPTLIILCLLISYSEKFPLLRIFPWATFTRVASRGTILYAPLLAVLSLGIDWKKFSRSITTALILVFILLGFVEVHTAWTMYHRDRKPAVFTENMAQYMQRIASEPGDAILDWPFTIAGGNGIGTGLLGQYFVDDQNVFSFHTLHGKKVMGCYFGRLYPQMFMPLSLAGWEDMFMPDSREFIGGKHQQRSFDDAQWNFFTRFFELGDFAGINLCLDLIAPGDEQNFYQRFGQPVATTTMPGVGRLAFIPKPASMRGHVDLMAAKNLKLDSPRTMKLNASIFLSTGNWEQAIPFLQRGVQLEPVDDQLQNNLAIAFVKTGKLAQAVEHFQKALEIQPNNPQYRNNFLRAQAALSSSMQGNSPR